MKAAKEIAEDDLPDDGASPQYRTQAIVDGLVEESRKVFSGIIAKREKAPASSSRFIDKIDKAWFWDKGFESLELPERFKRCRELESRDVPPRYADAVDNFKEIIRGFIPEDEDWLEPLENAANAILANFSGPTQAGWDIPTRVQSALQATVDDLYDSFLSKKDRSKLEMQEPPPGLLLPPPLTYISGGPAPFTQLPFFFRGLFELYLVGYPRYLAKGGLSVWPALAHETCGHAILDAFPELARELRVEILKAMEQQLGAKSYVSRDIETICTYWNSRFNEAISDCLGILFIGPSLAYSMQARLELENEFSLHGEEPEEHPSTLLRAYMSACAVGELKFDSKEKAISRQLKEDLAIRRQKLDADEQAYWDVSLMDIHPERSQEAAQLTAGIFSQHALTAKLESLNGNCLGRIQNWTRTDESLALRIAMKMGSNDFQQEWDSNLDERGKAYPAHLLAGAIMALPGKTEKGAESVFQNLVHAIHHARTTGIPKNDYFEDLMEELAGIKGAVSAYATP